MSWEAIGEAKLDGPVPGELSTRADAGTALHTCGSAVANGRVAQGLDTARTHLWTCELPEGEPVAALLAHEELVLAVRRPDDRGGQRVELIDAEGRHLRTIVGAAGDWAIDPRHRVLLGLTTDLDLGAWSLDDPDRAPALVFNRISKRGLDALRVVEPVLVALTHERRRLGGPPPDVLVDVLRVSDYQDRRRWGTLRSTRRVAERVAEGLERAVLGFDPAGVILATANQLWWGDWYLRERARLELGPEDGIHPLQLAPRDDGSAWLLVERRSSGRIELWHIAVGHRIHVIPQDRELVDASPLLIGPESGVVLAGSSQIASYSDEGASRWRWPRRGAPGGLIDGRGVTLCSNDDALISIDPTGDRTTVWSPPAPVERLGPIAATTAGMWVASGLRVFGLG